ncbi:hypothetical protein PA08_1737 [Cutibacterium modestum P08]|nr:hypothetical protein PA08_1737 [Cutibacterium modestum P08]
MSTTTHTPPWQVQSTAVADPDAVGCPKALVAGTQPATTATNATMTRDTAAAQEPALARRKHLMDPTIPTETHHMTR